MERGYWRQGTYYHRRIGFGVDNTLWICKPAPPEGYKEPDWLHNDDPIASSLDLYGPCHNNGYIGSLYDLRSSKVVKKIDMKYNKYDSGRPMVKILPGHKVLIKDDRTTWLFSKEGDMGSCKVHSEENMDNTKLRPIAGHYGDGRI